MDIILLIFEHLLNILNVNIFFGEFRYYIVIFGTATHLVIECSLSLGRDAVRFSNPGAQAGMWCV